MKIYLHPHSDFNSPYWQDKTFKVCWCCPRTELIIKQGLSKIPDIKLVDNEKDSDYVIWQHVPQYAGNKSFKLINRIDPKKLIVIDSIDENNEYFVENFNSSSYFLYFKRSILQLDKFGNKNKLDLPERCFPWDYAILDGFLFPEQEKTIDIGCYLRQSCYNRSLALYLMKKFNHPNSIVGEVSSGSRSNGQTVYYDPVYFNHLAKTKIIVSSGPYAWTGCSRPSEAFANKCLYLADEAYRFMPNAPIDGEHWLKWSPQIPDTLYEKLNFALENTAIAKTIAFDGYNHARKHHSSEARMKYVVEKIKEYG